MTQHRFINDILKPWDELNSLLSQQYAFQPDLSDITRLAGNIAVSIRHQIDSSDLNDKQAHGIWGHGIWGQTLIIIIKLYNSNLEW